MKDVYVATTLRTLVGSFDKVLTDIPTPHLATQIIRDTLQRSKPEPALSNEVILSQALQGGSAQENTASPPSASAAAGLLLPCLKSSESRRGDFK